MQIFLGAVGHADEFDAEMITGTPPDNRQLDLDRVINRGSFQQQMQLVSAFGPHFRDGNLASCFGKVESVPLSIIEISEDRHGDLL